MRVPLTTRDFLDRAELVYGDRVGIVDEPSQPAPSLGELTYREVARRGRALQAGLDELGVGEGERVAIVSHNSARLLELLLAVPSSGRVLVPINFRLSPGGGRLHRRALRRAGAARRPRAGGAR